MLAAGLLGSIATTPNIPTWYAHLVKPSFNPPDWIFAPVWTLLYIIMAAAFFRVLQAPSAGRWRTPAIGGFLVQITLNAAWSWVFFAGHDPRRGLIVIAALWIAIAATSFAFWRIDRWAGLCLLPYLAWVGFAALLNLEIFRLNPA